MQGFGVLSSQKSTRIRAWQHNGNACRHVVVIDRARQGFTCATVGPSYLTAERLVRPLRMFDRKPARSLAPAVESGRMRAEEVWMRPPEVFVRELAPHEGQRLKRLSKQSKLASTRQRALILLSSNTLMSAPEIARMLLTDESHVRKVIHDFNRHGFESLRPRFRGGRPRRISTDDEARIVAVAGARPDTLGDRDDPSLV